MNSCFILTAKKWIWRRLFFLRALYSFRQWIQTFPRDDGMTLSPPSRSQSGRCTEKESRPKAQRNFTDSHTAEEHREDRHFRLCRRYETTFNYPALAITLTCGFRGLYGDALCLILRCLFSLRCWDFNFLGWHNWKHAGENKYFGFRFFG